MQSNLAIRDSKQLVSTDYPYVVCPVMPSVFTYWTLPGGWERWELVRYCDQLVTRTKRRYVLVLGARECIYFAADGARTRSTEPPTGGAVFCEDTDRMRMGRKPPSYARVPDSKFGAEIHRDEDAGCVFRLERAGKRGRWRIRNHYFDVRGFAASQITFEGDAPGLYRHTDELGIEREIVAGTGLGVPTPAALYDKLVDLHLRGKRFFCEVIGAGISWGVQYSIFRDRAGWHLRVIGEAEGLELLDGPPVEEHGPFRTKGDLRDALAERGLDADVRF
jgi:hypothetical protein